MKIHAGLVCASAMAISGAASADILWDQSNYDTAASAYVNQAFGNFADFSTYMVNDITVDPGGWNVTSVTTYHTYTNGIWPLSGQAQVNVFARDAAAPGAGDDPSGGMVVDFTAVDLGDGTIAITAALDMDLAAGDYWIGMTPILDFGIFGQEFHRGAPIVGLDTHFRNPGGGFGVGTDWGTAGALFAGDWDGVYDAAMLVEGRVVPAPGVAALLVGGLLAVRRRRA